MSKRNFILLIVFLTLLVGGVLIFFYITRPQVGDPTNTDADSGTNFIAQFNPFGTSRTITPPNDTNNGAPTNPGDTQTPGGGVQLKLTRVSSMPIAGYTVYMKERYKSVPEVIPVAAEPVPDAAQTNPATTTKTPTPKVVPTAPPTEFVPALRYVDRATGNIFQTFTDAIEERKFTTTVIPQVYEAFFGNKAESVTMRYLREDDRTIATFVGSLPKELLGADSAEDNEIKVTYLPDNITAFSVSPDGLKSFYLFNSADSAVGIVATGVTSKSQVFDSAFTEWLTDWPNTSLLALSTKPSKNVPGYLYALDPAKKTFKKVLGDVSGLTTLVSPNGKLVLYGDGNLSMGIYNIETRETATVSLSGMPEKCVWAKTNDFIYCSVPKNTTGGEMPDDWYKGEVTFSDAIWKIDIANGNTELIMDPVNTQGGQDMDGIKLSLDDTGTYLFYVNKKDSYLWQLNLNK